MIFTRPPFLVNCIILFTIVQQIITYSSLTIRNQATSRNQEHFRCFEEIKSLLGERPVVLDREFSYEELLANLVLENIHFVIRLNLGDPRKPVRFLDAEGQPMKLYLLPGDTIIYPNVYYIYLQRMKIEQTFRDCQDLLHLPKLMNKQQYYLEQMIALTLIAYVIGLWLGEAMRDVIYGKVDLSH